MDIIVVCHTEFGFVDKKTKRLIFDKQATQGAKEGSISLIKLAEKYNAKITFAVCPEVVDFFPKNIGHEIGLHIHPGWEEFTRDGFKWRVGDMYLKEHCLQSSVSTAMSGHPYSEQFLMIKTGKEFLKDKLGADSKVFVAGRWSFNNDTTQALVDLGFTHDCSAYPSLMDWKNLPRISMPYNLNGILEIPVSRMLFGGAACPEDVRRFGLPWLKACFSEYYLARAPLFHIALHSPCMTDPYYIEAMDNFLSFISKHKDVNFKFASEIKEYPGTKAKTKIAPYLFALNKELAKTVFKKMCQFKGI